VSVPVRLSVCLSYCLSECLSVCLTVCVCSCPSVSLSVLLYVCLSVCLYVLPPVVDVSVSVVRRRCDGRLEGITLATCCRVLYLLTDQHLPSVLTDCCMSEVGCTHSCDMTASVSIRPLLIHVAVLYEHVGYRDRWPVD